MPVTIGPLEIVNVGGGIVHFGDTAYTTPKEKAKTFAGSGGFNTGGLVISNTATSSTNILDKNQVDQPIAGNS